MSGGAREDPKIYENVIIWENWAKYGNVTGSVQIFIIKENFLCPILVQAFFYTKLTTFMANLPKSTLNFPFFSEKWPFLLVFLLEIWPSKLKELKMPKASIRNHIWSDMSAPITIQKIWFGKVSLLAFLKNYVNMWGHQDER